MKGLPTFTIRNILNLKAPAADFSDVSFEALLNTEAFYQGYLEGKSKDLERFICCLYTEINGFQRIYLEENAKRIRENCDFLTKERILNDYTEIRHQLARIYPYVFNPVFHEPNGKVNTILHYIFEFESEEGDGIEPFNIECIKVFPFLDQYGKKCCSLGIGFANKEFKMLFFGMNESQFN